MLYKDVNVKVLEYGNVSLITLSKDSESIVKVVDSFKITDSYLHNLVDLYLQLLKAFKEY